MTSKKLLKGNIVTPTRVIHSGGLLLHGGKITRVLENDETTVQFKENADTELLDFSGRYILPGAVDAHVHVYSEPREGMAAATKAAAAGGVTTIIDMPYDAGALADTVERINEKKQIISEEAHVDVALHGTVKPGNGGVDIQALVDSGVAGFKVSMFETDPNRFPRINNGELESILQYGHEARVTVGVHAEDGEIINARLQQLHNAGRTDPIAHCESRPPISELSSVTTGVSIAKSTSAPFHIFHASLPETVKLVRDARAAGADISVETCPHYLLLDEGDMPRLGAKAKINPPMRSQEEVAEMWQLMNTGDIDMVTSDHAPWHLDKKNNSNIFQNASGAPGVQAIYPLMLSEGFLAGRVSLLTLVRMMAENPAKRFRLGHRKGQLVQGFDADIVIFDPNTTTEISVDLEESNAGWSPYEGMTLMGAIEEVLLRGEVVFQKTRGVLADARYGSFVKGASR